MRLAKQTFIVIFNMNDPKAKALAISYILCELLKQNLDIAIHELRVIDHQDVGKLDDKLNKLNSASKNAFRVLNKNIGSEGLSEMKKSIEIVLDNLWD